MNEIAFNPRTSILALLKAGWMLKTSLRGIEYEVYVSEEREIVVRRFDGKNEAEKTRYPLTTAGLEQAAERVNLQGDKQ